MSDADPNGTTQPVAIPVDGDRQIHGDVSLPPSGPAGLVIFAHGSGSSRHSPRNRSVASGLVASGLATLLVDLLTQEEDELDQRTAELRFDIDLLTSRLLATAQWCADEATLGSLHFGYFGASTGAAAALKAAARQPDGIGAVLSRGGRPDLAGAELPAVRAPTLLIVGGNDPEVLDLNRQAAAQLTAPHEIEVVAGATHLFPEPGALEQVTELSIAWFHRHFA